MTSAIQISGNIQSDNTAFSTLQSMLEQLDIQVTHPFTDESSFFINSQHPAWHHYDTELGLYDSIANAPFHIVLNDGPITDDIGRQILYAISKDRPIVMTGRPVFSKKLSPFVRDLIKKHVHDFHCINLPELDQHEIKHLIENLKPKNYGLSESEKILINSRIKAHFRRLLEEARDIYVAG